MKKKLVALLLSASCLASLAGCNKTAETTSSKALPSTNEEVVEKVAGVAAIAYMTNGSTGQNLVQADAGTNTVPSGGYLKLATSYAVQAQNGDSVVSVNATIEWTLSDMAGWVKSTSSTDKTHITLTPSTPHYGEDDLKPTLTGKITFADASKELTYKVVVPAKKVAPVEYLKLSELYTAAITNKKINVDVVTYGYVVGFSADYANVYIAADGYGCQLYGASSFKTSYVAGNLIKVTGTITNYYGLELTGVTAVEVLASKEGVGSPDPVALTETDITVVAGKNGTKWDNAYISVAAVYSDYNKGTLKFTVGAAVIYIYLKSSMPESVLNGYKAQFTSSTATGGTYNIKGVVSVYEKTTMFEIIPWQAGWITAA
jgi:hypothetical protein